MTNVIVSIKIATIDVLQLNGKIVSDVRSPFLSPSFCIVTRAAHSLPQYKRSTQTHTHNQKNL